MPVLPRQMSEATAQVHIGASEHEHAQDIQINAAGAPQSTVVNCKLVRTNSTG